MKRLPQGATQRIDRFNTVNFTWQGRSTEGLAGDSLASALYANGVRIFSRSLKYHRPRGLYSLDGESGNTLVHVNGECNVRAEERLLEENMQVMPQNCWGLVENDRLAFMDCLDRLMPAGFYYRTMHKPSFIWPMASKFIRKMAGTGVLDASRDWDRFQFNELYPHAEVCVIGGGPAGMSAALAAAEHGLRVILMEARPWLGGHYDWRVREYEGQSLHDRGLKLTRQVTESPNIRVFPNTSVIDLSGSNQVTAIQNLNQNGTTSDGGQCYIRFTPRSVVVATGALERPLVFENNDLPGIMQVGCAWRLARTYGVLPGQRAVFSVGDDLGLEAALDLSALGMNVRTVADLRSYGHDLQLVARLEEKKIPFLRGYGASVAKGKKQISKVMLKKLDGNGSQHCPCDLLVSSAGLTPRVGPLSTVGAKLKLDAHTGFFLPHELPPGVFASGRLLAYDHPDAIEAQGRLAGLQAAEKVVDGVVLSSAEKALAQLPGPAKGTTVAHSPGIGQGRKAFICFDEDGTLKTVHQTMAQGFDQPELAKRFGGFGLGPGQSGIPGHNLPLIMSKLRGESSPRVAPTTLRSPLSPVLMGAVAGPRKMMIKQTPLHAVQQAKGAVFERTGSWMRANRFSRDKRAAEEIEAVRKGVGLLDVSTLGKFRLYGSDALNALQRVYISDMSTVTTGKLKYSAMLNDAGMLLDDGVVTQVGENDYYLTTSSARAGETEQWIRYHTRFETWDYHIVDLTDSLAAVNLAGPHARDVLAQLTGEDISNPAFPYMGYHQFELQGLAPVRALRVGFLGELSYELHVPASYGEALWKALLAAGARWNIRPIGLEAQNVCRMEKGHVIVGLESEQRTNLLDLGLGFLWDHLDVTSHKVGSPALTHNRDQKGRMKLVGLEIDGSFNGKSDCPGDGAIIHQGDEIVGYLCTARWSATLGKVLGTALVKEPLNQIKSTLNIYQNEGQDAQHFQGTVVPMPFYDPEGTRLRA